MDKLDKWTIFLVTAMTLYASALLFTAGDAARPERHQQVRAMPVRPVIVNPELENKIQTAKDLLAQDSLDKGEAMLTSLLQQYPYEGGLYILQGDLFMRRQQAVAAMYAYKEAVELNPDFLDKKTKDFQGRKIKVTVEEALTQIESGLRGNPNDSKLKKDQKILYYMQRKLAGSCG